MNRTYPLVPEMILQWIHRLGRWLESRQPQVSSELGPSARFWANPQWALVCFVFLLATLFMPSDGFGIRLCFFHLMTGLDCPGCGMTRGLSQFWRGHLVQSLELHLFAPLAFIFLGLQSSSLFFPDPLKSRIALWIDRHDALFRYFWIAGAAGFFTYGALRIAYGLFRGGIFQGF